jgi:ribonuclease-3
VRWGRRRGSSAGADLLGLIEGLPPELAREAFTHASWTEERARSYGRLAFLGDSVLGLAVATEVFHRFPESDIGPLTKIHNQAVSGRACADVALALGLDKRLREMEPEHTDTGIGTDELVASERAMASVAEAAIGACYLTHGYEATAAAVVAAFAEEIDTAARDPADFKSSLQELLARRGARVSYDVVQEAGPPHERRFEVTASVDGVLIGSGVGRSKKAAEQAAAEQALARMG